MWQHIEIIVHSRMTFTHNQINMEELNKRIYYLHSQIDLLLKWSNTMKAEQKNASRQLFKDIWLFDIELLQYLDGKKLPEWT